MTAWEISRLTGWRSAGGRVHEPLGPAYDGTQRRVEFGDRGPWTLVLDRQIAEPLLTGRDIVGIVRRDFADYHEARIMSRRVVRLSAEGVEADRLVCTAYPRLWDLADCDLVREWIGGEWRYRFDVTLTCKQVLARFFFTRLAEDRLAGLALGSAPDDVPLRWQFDRWTRGQLLDDVLARSFTDLRWSRVGAVEQLDLVDDLGADAPRVPLHFGDRLLALDETTDWDALATAYRLAGETVVAEADAAGFGENAWRVDAVSAPSGGQVVVTLREIDGTRHPILEDGMFAAHADLGLTACCLQRSNGITRAAILASSATTGTVTVSTAQAPVAGEIVTLVANAAGDPLELLVLPVSARAHGLVVGDQQVPGMRPERNYLRNGGHEDGLAEWTPVHGGVGVETTRTELGRDLEFYANGSRAPGTGTGTPLAVDGLTPLTDRVLRGALITHVGWQSAVDAPTIADPTGVLAIPLATPTGASYADGALVRLRRRELVNATVDVSTPMTAGRLFLDLGDAPLAQRLAAFARFDVYGGGAAGDVRLVSSGGASFDGNLNSGHVHEDNPDVLVLRYAAFGADGAGGVGGAPHPASNLQVVSAHRIRITTDDHTLTGSLLVDFVRVGGGTQLPPWLFHPSGGGILRFIGTIVGGGLIGGTTPYLDIDVTGLPVACDLTGLTGYIASYAVTGFATMCYVYTSGFWSGTFALTWLRETRTLELDGPHSIGAATLLCRAIPALARRDFVASDVLHLAGADYVVTGAGTWTDAGTVSVPIAVPGGVTLHAGTKVWTNFLGTSEADALFVVAATVIGPASAITLRGGDRYPATWDGTLSYAQSVYRVTEDALLEVPGEVLEVGVTAAADGSGAAAITLAAPNVESVPDNALLRMHYPRVVGPTDRTNGSLLRLLCPPDGSGQPNSLTPGIASALAWFRCPDESTRPITVVSQFRLSLGDWFTGVGPAVAIVDALGTILTWAALDEDGITIDADAATVMLAAQAVITQSGWYGIRVYGGSADRSLWCLHDQSMFYAGAALDAPYIRGSAPSSGFLRCARVLRERAAPRISDTLELEEMSTMFARALGLEGLVPRIVLGGRVHITERNRLARVTGYTERPGGALSDIAIGQVLPDGGRLLGEAALATNTRGLR